MDENIYMTQQGLENLRAELKNLEEVLKPANSLRIKTARDMGDVSENAEYSIAREEQTKIDFRISEIEAMLKKVKVVEVLSNEASIGSKVVVHVEGNDEEFHIVGDPEADPLANKISHKSPLGVLLVGKKVGEEFEYSIPTGKIKYKVIEIK